MNEKDTTSETTVPVVSVKARDMKITERHAEILSEFLDDVDRSGARSAGVNLAWALSRCEEERDKYHRRDRQSPMLVRMPPSFRARIRDAITDPKARASFDGLMEWEDDVVAAFNAVSSAADRMADALQLIAEWKFFCDERVNDHPAVRFTARAALDTGVSVASKSSRPGEGNNE